MKGVSSSSLDQKSQGRSRLYLSLDTRPRKTCASRFDTTVPRVWVSEKTSVLLTSTRHLVDLVSSLSDTPRFSLRRGVGGTMTSTVRSLIVPVPRQVIGGRDGTLTRLDSGSEDGGRVSSV